MSMENRDNEQQPYSTAGQPHGTPANPPYQAVVDDARTAPESRWTPPAAGAPYPPGHYGAAPMPGAPNPGLAALLGFIPGVGAMYNGQFAKGLAHIAIFAVFCSLSKHVNGVFGLFVAGWVLYMAFEAYQTALARRDGLPLPDPFGLNNIGERFGFRSNPTTNPFWAQGSTTNPVGQPPTGPATYPYGAAPAPFQVDPNGTVFRSASGAAEPPPASAYVPPAGYNYAPPAPPTAPAYGAPGYSDAPAYGAGAYGFPPVPPMPPVRGAGLPAGALWLIGLGLFALLGSMRAFDFLQGEATGGIFLMGLALFLLWRRWNQSRDLYPGDSAASGWAALQCARGPVVLFVVGLLTLLQGVRVVYWENSWPFLLIVLGAYLLVERLAANRMNAAVPYAAPVPPDGPVAPPTSSTSILPRYSRTVDETSNREGQ